MRPTSRSLWTGRFAPLASVLALAALVACSSSAGSTPVPTAADFVGSYQGEPGAKITWFAFLPANKYELQPASCPEPSCYVSGTYEIGADNTLDLTDDGTGHPASLPLSDVSFSPSSESATLADEPLAGSVHPLGAGLVGPSMTSLVSNQVNGFNAGGGNYQLVAASGTCAGTCKLTSTVFTPFTGNSIRGSSCDTPSWGSCGLGYTCCGL
jgi:hypothetical protein